MESVKRIRYVRSNLSHLQGEPIRIDIGFYLAVESGSAVFDTGLSQYHLQDQCELNIFTGCVARLYDATDDFMVRMFTYPIEMHREIFDYIGRERMEWNAEHPYYLHTPDSRSQRTWHEVNKWMDMAEMLFGTHASILFPDRQETNFLHGFWMWNVGTIQEKIEESPVSRQRCIYDRFISMVQEFSIQHHNVTYFAEKLNITPRYLSKIVREQTHGSTPKHLIDRTLMMLIKERLRSGRYSLTQIADELNFPDQSYLSRFFYRHEGHYPTKTIPPEPTK